MAKGGYRTMRSGLGNIATLLTAAGIGWGGAKWWSQPTGTPAALERRHSSRGAHEEDRTDVSGFLDEFIDRSRGGGAAGLADRSFRNRFDELRTTLKPTTDPGATARELLAACPSAVDPAERTAALDPMATAAVRLLQWLEADPPALADFLVKAERQDMVFTLPFTVWGEETPPDEVYPVLARFVTSVQTFPPMRFGSPGANAFRDSVMTGLLRKSVAEGDPAAFKRISASLPDGEDGMEHEELAGIAIKLWPQDHLSALASLAIETRDRSLTYRLLQRIDGEDYLRLRGSARGRGMSEFAQGRDADVASRLANLTPQQKVDCLAAIGLPKDHKILPDRKADACRDLLKAEAARMNDDPRTGEIVASFKKGGLSPEEALRNLALLLPDTAALSPDTLKQQLASLLIAAVPSRAGDLLTGSPAEREVGLARLLQDSGRSDAGLVETLQAVPFDPLSDGKADRRSLWRSITDESYHRYGAAFIPIVTRMPPGPDRSMALSQLADAVMPTDPAKAAELRMLFPAGDEKDEEDSE